MLTVQAPTFKLPLNHAKLVERRKRTRIDRSRLIANNAELQRSIIDTTRMYNNEMERNGVKNALDTSFGPSLARVTREVRAGVITPVSTPRLPVATPPSSAARSSALAHIRLLDAEQDRLRACMTGAPEPKPKPRPRGSTVHPTSLNPRTQVSTDQTRLG
jgi:hypothetical protein